MLEERLILIFAYIFIATLLLSLCLYTDFSKKTKFFTIIISSVFYVYTWKAYEFILGWPTFEELPDNFQINWAIIEEPNKRIKKDGSLYLWVTELDPFGKRVGEPRSHNLYWNDDNHKLVQSALHKLQEGEQLNGKKTYGVINKDNEGNESTQYDQSTVEQEEGNPSFEFFEVSPPSLPQKTLIPDN